MPLTKICTKCGVEKDVSGFYKQKKGKDGLFSKCKECNAIKCAEWYIANRDKHNAVALTWTAANSERVKNNKANWCAANKERLKAKAADYYLANKERVKTYQTTWREVNRKKKKITDAIYRKTHPESVKAQSHRRRARKRNAEGTHTASDIKNLLTLQKSKCALCKTSIKKKYHVDHIIPLVRQGSNDKHNLQLLCPSCNLKKHARDPIEYVQSLGLLI